MEEIRQSPFNLPVADKPARSVAGKHFGQGWLRRWVHNWHTRSLLLGLSEDQLKDLGLSRASADEEGRRPFWRG